MNLKLKLTIWLAAIISIVVGVLHVIDSRETTVVVSDLVQIDLWLTDYKNEKSSLPPTLAEFRRWLSAKGTTADIIIRRINDAERSGSIHYSSESESQDAIILWRVDNHTVVLERSGAVRVANEDK